GCRHTQRWGAADAPPARGWPAPPADQSRDAAMRCRRRPCGTGRHAPRGLAPSRRRGRRRGRSASRWFDCSTLDCLQLVTGEAWQVWCTGGKGHHIRWAVAVLLVSWAARVLAAFVLVLSGGAATARAESAA